MKKIYYLTIFMILTCSASYGQIKPMMGQYFQNLPAHAPALTGANDYLDLRLGVRQQWSGFQGAPVNVFLSAYSPIKDKNGKSQYQRMRLGIEEEQNQKIKLKHGVGASLQSNEQDLFKQVKFNVNYAVHVPVFQDTYLSFGMTAGFLNEKIDLSDVNLKNEVDDATYQSLVSNGATYSNLNISGGLALNSKKYYFSYSMHPLAYTRIAGNDKLADNDNYVRHQIILGGRFYLNQNVEVIPNGFVRLEAAMPLLFDTGVRVRYQQNFWAGASYRNDDTFIGMLGFTYNDIWKFSYSYEYGLSDLNNYNSGSHEIVLGVQLFNYNRYTSMW